MCAEVSLEDGMRPDTYFMHGPDGHSYHFNKVMKGGRLSFECMNYRKTCRGRASVGSDGLDFRQTQHHNHCPNWNLLHERRLRSAVLDKCRNGDTNPLRTIYDEVRRELRIPRLAAVNIPFWKLRPSMQNARYSTLPPLPHTLSELDVILRDPRYAFLTTTFDGVDNIYAGAVGSTQDRTRCLIFMSRRMLRYLRRKEMIFSDATFSIVPSNIGCAQVWNIVVLRRHHIIPIGSILMQSKLTRCYRAALDGLKQLLPGWQPNKIMCDYEASQHKAYAQEFPMAERKGCHFHASKAMLLHSKEIGLLPLIREDALSDTIVRSLCALPLLPTGMLLDGLDEMADYAMETGRWDQLSPLFEYVRETWLRPSRLPIFSVHNCEDRTSNCCECYNKIMRSAVGQLAHPNVYFLISAMVRLEDRFTQDMYTLKHGGRVGGERKWSAICNDQIIKGLTQELQGGEITIRTFLRRASRRVQNVYNDIMWALR